MKIFQNYIDLSRFNSIYESTHELYKIFQTIYFHILHNLQSKLIHTKPVSWLH